MTDAPATPDHKTFDLLDALAGVSHPETTVDVYLDDSLMYLISQTDAEIRKAEIRGEKEQKDTLEAKIAELKEQAATVKFEFTIRAIPRGVHTAIIAETEKEHPDTKDFLGRVEPNPERDEFFSNKFWAAHITQVKAPTGAVQQGLTPEYAAAFRSQAPRSAINAVQKAIDSLYANAEAGYENVVQETSFLSGASLGA